MPNRHRFPAATFRPDPEVYERAKAAVAEVGSDINAHVNWFLRWIAGDTDQLPPRPKPAEGTTDPEDSEPPTS